MMALLYPADNAVGLLKMLRLEAVEPIPLVIPLPEADEIVVTISTDPMLVVLRMGVDKATGLVLTPP